MIQNKYTVYACVRTRRAFRFKASDNLVTTVLQRVNSPGMLHVPHTPRLVCDVTQEKFNETIAHTKDNTLPIVYLTMLQLLRLRFYSQGQPRGGPAW